MKATELDRHTMAANWRDVERINTETERAIAELVAEGVPPQDAFGELLRRRSEAVRQRLN